MDPEMRRLARSAIERFEGVMRVGADAPHAEIKAAVDCVIALRDRAIGLYRQEGVSRQCLDRVNALVSLTFGVEFPLSGFHLHRIEQARDNLCDLLEGEGRVAHPAANAIV